jgi:hypothetical protein
MGRRLHYDSIHVALGTASKKRVNIGMNPGIDDGSSASAVTIAIIDGPYDAATLSRVLAHTPTSLAPAACGVNPDSACDHGTFIMGLLGAGQDTLIPGLCPDCRLVHIPLFVDVDSPSASIDELATAIRQAVTAGARLINLSLAILGDDSQDHPGLAAALDLADMSGAVLLVAAGNQSRLAMGQLLSHPVAIPVVGVDASQRLLLESNFGPAISGRGVAALGRMPGYAPGGGTTVMSGTSVATAVATGTLAQVWSQYPEVDGARLRTAVAALGPRNGLLPPFLSGDLVRMALDQMPSALVPGDRSTGNAMTSYVSLQGGTAMTNENAQSALRDDARLIARPAQTVAPAGGAGESTCGARGGACTCNQGPSGVSGFVYAIGTIEAEYPNLAIEREMQILAHDMEVQVEPDPDLPTKPTEDRRWQHAVLTQDKKRTRFIARQLRWRLTIEDEPVFILKPNDPAELDELIDALARPKYVKPERSGRKRRGESLSIEPPLGLPQDLDVVIGVTPDGMAVMVEQIFQIKAGQLAPHGWEHFAQLSDNHGLTDEDRAYNFLTARYKPQQQTGLELTGVRMAASRLSANGGRIVRAIYTFRDPATDVEKEFFVRVDVTNEFPILVHPWTPYLERGEA